MEISKEEIKEVKDECQSLAFTQGKYRDAYYRLNDFLASLLDREEKPQEKCEHGVASGISDGVGNVVNRVCDYCGEKLPPSLIVPQPQPVKEIEMFERPWKNNPEDDYDEIQDKLNELIHHLNSSSRR